NAATSATSGYLCEQYLYSDSVSDDDNDLHTDQDDAPNLQSSDDSGFEIDQKLQVGGVSRSLEDLQKVANYVKAHPTYKFSVVQRRFRWIKQQCMIPRILSAVEKNGNFRQKYADISKAVLAKYKDARRQLHPVHDTDLKKWAVDAARAIGIKFTASSYWIFKFKRQHRISSRKVTTRCTRRQLGTAEAIAQSAITFRAKVLEEAPKYQNNHIFNNDQSGFNYEMASTRTLSNTGEKDTVLVINSHNKCTHSYTIQPLIDYDGNTRGKLYVCLQEKDGRMGPQVEKTYFRAP